MTKPLVVYLDSSDYSKLSNPRKSADSNLERNAPAPAHARESGTWLLDEF